jgi:hypothetical protein
MEDTGMIDDRLSDEAASKAYKLLHTHALHGYEPGDCHCDGCDVIVQELVEYFGITRGTGVYSPAALVRQRAHELGW